MYRRKHGIYRVWYYLRFQASTGAGGGLRMYPPRTRGDYYCTLKTDGDNTLEQAEYNSKWCQVYTVPVKSMKTLHCTDP